MPEIGNIKSLEIFFAVLPGLLTYLTVRFLTSRDRRLESLEAVLHGLAYTLLAHALWELIQYLPAFVRPQGDILGLSISALLLGVFASYLVNTDRIYSLLRFLGITQEASWNTIWESTFREFHRNQGKYVILTLQDERRVYGWLVAYSSDQKEGHICLEDIVWLDNSLGDESAHPRSLLRDWMAANAGTGIKGLHLFRADQVKCLHFITADIGSKNE